MNIPTITPALILVSTIAGGVYFIEARYQSRQEAEEIHAGLSRGQQLQRLNDVTGRIIRLQNEQKRRPLSQDEKDWLRRLTNEYRYLCSELKIKCR